IYSAAVIVFQSFAYPKRLALRLGGFTLGLFLFLIPQLTLINFSSDPEAIPDIFTLQGGAGAVLHRLTEGLPFLTAANIGAVWWMPHQLVGLLTRTGSNAPWLIWLTVIGWTSLPVLLART